MREHFVKDKTDTIEVIGRIIRKKNIDDYQYCTLSNAPVNF